MPTSSKTLKIAFFDHTVLLSGGERSLLQLLEALDRRQYEPILIAPQAGDFPNAVKALKIPVHYLTFPKRLSQASRKLRLLALPWYVWDVYQVLKNLRKICTENQIQILHTNSLKAHVIGAFLNLKQVKVIWHMRDILKPGITRLGFNFLARLSPQKIVCISQEVARQFGHLSKTIVIHNAVNLSSKKLSGSALALLKRVTVLKKNQKDIRVWVLACVGQIAAWKGQDVFIDAIQHLKQRGHEVLGLVVGSVLFPEREARFAAKLHKQVQEAGLEKNIIFTGYQNPVEPWFEIADLVVHCNRDFEPFGRTLVEAMLSSRVVVTNQKVAAKEVLAPDLRSFAVPAGNSQALAECLEDLMQQPHKIKQLSKSLKPWAEVQFSTAKMMGRVYKLYRELL